MVFAKYGNNETIIYTSKGFTECTLDVVGRQGREKVDFSFNCVVIEDRENSKIVQWDSVPLEVGEYDYEFSIIENSNKVIIDKGILRYGNV